MLPIAIIICVVFLLFVQRMVYRKLWDKNLKVDISFEQRRVIENEPIKVSVEVVNGKRLPLPSLLIIFSLPKEFREIRTNDIVAADSWRRNELFALFSFQRMKRELEFSCQQRGIYNIADYTLDNRSFFMDEEYSKTYSLNKQIMVYPAAVDVRRFVECFQSVYGTILSNDFHYEDAFTIRGVREYQPFDSQKRINWNATAKLNKLIVNNYEFTTNRKVVIFLNLSLDLLAQERSIGEESIRLVKSWCMNLDKNGIQANVYSNGIDSISGGYVFIEKESLKKKYMETVNESLTRVIIRETDEDFFDIYGDTIMQYSKDYYILVVSAFQHDEFQGKLLSVLERNPNLTWIIPVNNNSDYRPKERLKKHTIAWDIYWRKERSDGLLQPKRFI